MLVMSVKLSLNERGWACHLGDTLQRQADSISICSRAVIAMHMLPALGACPSFLDLMRRYSMMGEASLSIAAMAAKMLKRWTSLLYFSVSWPSLRTCGALWSTASDPMSRG